ncbi:MAG: hydroxymethylglutaryl-CoA reductase [Candidatus Omnitrophota bacterium]|jgi:hydroxymethylglutaryl-CoA reductase (NADPH)
MKSIVKEDKIIERPPINMAKDYSKEFISQRLSWLSNKTNTKLHHISQYSQPSEDMRGNIENPIGVCQIPLGIAGPLKINGEYAKGAFYIPMATVEGTLLKSYDSGMAILTRAGGVNVKIFKDEIHIAPIFILDGLNDITKFIEWIRNNFNNIKKETEKTTKHGKLLRIDPIVASKRVILKFSYFTEDAMGANMVAIATESACKYIFSETGKKFFIKSNLCSDKKASMHNFVEGYGKSVFADISIPEHVVKFFGTTPKEMFDYYHAYVIGNSHAGMIGMNGHVANGIGALFLACGQDVAEIIGASMTICHGEVRENGDAYISVYIPSLLVGTVGGGASLVTQRECLEVLGCYGSGKAKKFAEIAAAVALAGEFSICASIANHTFVKAFMKYGRKSGEKGKE